MNRFALEELRKRIAPHKEYKESFIDVLDAGDVNTFLGNVGTFCKDDEFKRKTGIDETMLETILHLDEHATELLKNPSRRDFLKNSATLAAGAALTYAMPRKAHAEVIRPNVTHENYKQFVYSRGNCIVVYTNDRKDPGNDGTLYTKALEERLGNRIPIFKIDFGYWPNSVIQEWIDNENGKDIVPSFHIILNNKREVRIRGPPAQVNRNEYVDKVDNYLKSKGI